MDKVQRCPYNGTALPHWWCNACCSHLFCELMWYATTNPSTICFEQTLCICGVEPPTLFQPKASALRYTLDCTPLVDVNVCTAGLVCLVCVNKRCFQVRLVSIEGEIIAPINFGALLLRVLQAPCSATR